MVNKTKYILLAANALLFATLSFGQDVRKTVFVEGAYRPEVQAADKYGNMPSISDTARLAPVINYSVIPSQLQTRYTIKPIKPAKLVGSSIDELYKSHLKLGLGNYTTPLAEYSIHNLRSKEYAVGAYVFHRSSHTKLQLADSNKVPAGYGKNRVNVYGKKFYNKVNVEGDIFLKTDKYRYYGYNTILATDTNLEQRDIRQYYTQVGGKAEVYSTDPDPKAFHYKIGIGGSYFGDDYQNRENHLHLPLMAGFNVSSFRLDMEGAYNLFSTKFDTAGPVQKHVAQLHPSFKKSGGQWDVKLGLNLFYTMADKAAFHIFPDALLKFKVIPSAMNASVGVSGKLEVNSLAGIAAENPFIAPGLEVGDTKHKIIGFAGLDGILSKNSGYKLSVSFNSLDNVYFFVNDTSSILQNQFVVRTDKMELVKFSGETWYSPYSFLDFYLKASYSSFNLTFEEHPWHVPAVAMSFTTSYNFKEKIFASFDIINYGKRYAYNWQDESNPVELPAIWDLNLRLEYKYSDVLSGFVDVYNLLSKKYYFWNQYPTQKINFLAGFTYKF
ncbi:MAG: TonB-dependent receptor [Bacteroidales bacterium]|nr:TonB-dependent receptor [Bacteroidales bacterium]